MTSCPASGSRVACNACSYESLVTRVGQGARGSCASASYGSLLLCLATVAALCLQWQVEYCLCLTVTLGMTEEELQKCRQVAKRKGKKGRRGGEGHCLKPRGERREADEPLVPSTAAGPQQPRPQNQPLGREARRDVASSEQSELYELSASSVFLFQRAPWPRTFPAY